MNNKLSESVRIVWVFIMVMYVQIVAACLNFDVFVPRIIVIMMTWTIFLITPYVIFRKKYLYVIATSMLFLDGLINLFHWIILKCPLNASSIFVFMNTNFNEASAYNSVYCIICYCFKIYPQSFPKTEKESVAMVGIVDFYNSVFCRQYYPQQIRASCRPRCGTSCHIIR